MKRYILTGTPGSGKTTLIRHLEILGHNVVEEAVTDIITLEQSIGNFKPWESTTFIDNIVRLQKQRQLAIADSQDYKFIIFDRSPICTYALCKYLGYNPSKILLDEIERISQENIYCKRVFFIENLGYCTPTEARQISYEESLLFEKIHEETYTSFGYECLRIKSQKIASRVASILNLID